MNLDVIKTLKLNLHLSEVMSATVMSATIPSVKGENFFD